MRLQNDSIIALSKQLPTDPIDESNPESIARLVNIQDVNCVPWSLCTTVSPSDGRRRSMAMPSALVTSADVGWLSIDHPTTRRLNASRTTAQSTLPSLVGCSV